MTDVGSQIRAARKSANLSQSELGEKIGRTSKTVRRYEQGKTQPDTNILSLIASATDHPVEFFLSSKTRAASLSPSFRTNRPIGESSEAEAARTVYEVPVVTIEGSRLVRTGEQKNVPAFFLERVGLDTDSARLLDVPKGHYDAQRQLRPSDTLILDVLNSPSTLADFVQADRFVDGRYVVKIGTAGLQIKDLTARPDGTVAIASLDDSQKYRCTSDEQAGVTVHAIVAMSF
jgi:transcriptional regulator with XRE-family HTH domain